MSYEEVKNEYLDYLMNRIGLEKDGDDGYQAFCEKLQNSDFLPMLDMDGNRCVECLELRDDFASEFERETDQLRIPLMLDRELSETGTMLELLLIMAEKMRYELADSEYEANTRKFFIELLDNCGLSLYAKNSDYRKEGSENEVDRILYTVIFREIGWDGEGGLFPLYLTQRDQRRIELTAQMNDYLEENYDIC